MSEVTARKVPSDHDMRRKRPPALSFLLRMATARRVARVVSLLALDFAGSVEEILPQPFRLRFETAAGEFREFLIEILKAQTEAEGLSVFEEQFARLRDLTRRFCLGE